MKKLLTLIILLTSIGYTTAQTQEKQESKEEKIPDIFKEHKWLNKIVDYKDCEGYTVQNYTTEGGHHKYVVITTDEEKKMYTKEGKAYCTDHSSLNCIEFYKIEPNGDEWTCDDE